MKTQIPIYRAKKIDSDRYYIGFYYSADSDYIIDTESYIEDNGYINHINADDYLTEIDPSTLAISFDGESFFDIALIKTLVQDNYYDLVAITTNKAIGI